MYIYIYTHVDNLHPTKGPYSILYIWYVFFLLDSLIEGGEIPNLFAPSEESFENLLEAGLLHPKKSAAGRVWGLRGLGFRVPKLSGESKTNPNQDPGVLNQVLILGFGVPVWGPTGFCNQKVPFKGLLLGPREHRKGRTALLWGPVLLKGTLSEPLSYTLKP